MVIVTRFNPNSEIREVKVYPSTKKGKREMGEDSLRHHEAYTRKLGWMNLRGER